MITQKEGFDIVYRIAICDDDEVFSSELREMVSAILSERHVEHTILSFSSAETLLAHICLHQSVFDLFLLDVYMANLNGIDAAREIRSKSSDSAIVFTTSSQAHVYMGYEVQALRYLLKPIQRQALAEALTADLKARYENRYFTFKSSGMTYKVPFDEIIYLESMFKTVRLVAEGGAYEMYGLISNIEIQLPSLSFFRCHRGFIINFRHVSKINAQAVVTSHGTQIPIGKTYAQATSRAFLHYIGGNG